MDNRIQPGSPNTRLPWLKRRVFFLFLALALCAAGAGVALHALVKLHNKVNRDGSLVSTTDQDVTINIDNVYVTGILSAVAALGIAVTTAAFLIYTLWPRRSHGEYILSQALFLIGWTCWLFITLVAETAFFNSGRPTITVTGDIASIQIGDLRSAYRPIRYMRNSIILLWFSWASVLVCTCILFVAGNQVRITRDPAPKKYGLTADELAGLPKKDPGHRHDPDELDEVKEKRRSNSIKKAPRSPTHSLPLKESEPAMVHGDLEKGEGGPSKEDVGGAAL